jgi:tetratricopeptide (TPR) repeat protein
MLRVLLLALLAAASFGADPVYDLSGQFQPAERASVTLFGTTASFQASTLSDESGRFRFRKLPAGAYTLSIFVPGRGEAHRTLEVGAGTADSSRRVKVSLEFADSDFDHSQSMRARHSVSVRQLTIPDAALREFRAAQSDLGKPDAESALRHLNRAVEIAPQFASAWNLMGTMAYHEARYERAEECFRAALAADPQGYAPLVNLGGVLLNLGKLDEALDYNLHAVLSQPQDALANSQLGMTYFALYRYDLAVKYLEQARRLDPAHFSHPQLTLAEIHLRKGDRRAAASDMEDFLKHHPDYPQAPRMREVIAKLRKAQ